MKKTDIKKSHATVPLSTVYVYVYIRIRICICMYMTRNQTWNRNRSRSRSRSRNRSWNRNRNRNRIKILCGNRNRNRLQIFRFRNPGKKNRRTSQWGGGKQSTGLCDETQKHSCDYIKAFSAFGSEVIKSATTERFQNDLRNL
jgi:hypothetical protein